MSEDSPEQLKKRIRELEAELMRYRQEVSLTNQHLEKLIADLSSELKLASQIQRLLAPTEIPHISGIEFSTKFVPGMQFGGDYFDIFEHEDRMRFGILVSCCSGYGMSALLISVLMKLSAQIEAKKGMDPDKVLASMAQEIVPQVQNKDTASLFYAVVDRRTFEMKYSSIGSIFAALQIHGQDNVTQLEPSTKPLQAGYSDAPLTQMIQLGPRDRMIICTEGISESKSEDEPIEKFGKDRLLKTILRSPRNGVHEVRNEILYQVEQFVGNSEPVRDLTVIVTEVKDRVIKLAKKNLV